MARKEGHALINMSEPELPPSISCESYVIIVGRDCVRRVVTKETLGDVDDREEEEEEATPSTNNGWKKKHTPRGHYRC